MKYTIALNIVHIHTGHYDMCKGISLLTCDRDVSFQLKFCPNCPACIVYFTCFSSLPELPVPWDTLYIAAVTCTWYCLCIEPKPSCFNCHCPACAHDCLW